MKKLAAQALGRLGEAVEMPKSGAFGMTSRYNAKMDLLHPDWPPCEVCQKLCDPKTATVVWYCQYSDEAMTPEEAKAQGRHVYGCWVGSDCMRRNPQLKPYVAPRAAGKLPDPKDVAAAVAAAAPAKLRNGDLVRRKGQVYIVTFIDRNATPASINLDDGTSLPVDRLKSAGVASKADLEALLARRGNLPTMNRPKANKTPVWHY